jgi:hypothetical protein
VRRGAVGLVVEGGAARRGGTRGCGFAGFLGLLVMGR